MAIFNIYYVQRAATPEAGSPELRFWYSAYCLIVLYICVKFCENISDDTRVMDGTQMMEALMDGRTLKITEGLI